jgi:UDP-N-acetylmuramoyl-L-alanyl-D-glutamate--2,6-diaminopimelate ligase
MQLADLASRLDGASIANAAQVEVRGISHDSREVKPGDLFVCLVGAKFDGHKYAADALARGAAALCVVSGHESATIRRW